MALHWPVIENGDAPGRPTLPVSRAIVLMSVTVWVPCTEWLTPIVQAIVHRSAPRDRCGPGRGWRSASMPLSAAARSTVQPAEVGDQVVEAVDVAAHRVEVDEVLLQQHGEHAVEQGDVAPGPDRQVGVGDHRRLGHPGVDDDHRGTGRPRHHPRHEQRVVVGHVGAPQHEDVGQRQVVVAAGRAVGAEAELVAGHRATPCTGWCCRRSGRGPCRGGPACPACRTPRSRAGRSTAPPPTRARGGRAGRGTRSVTRSSAGSHGRRAAVDRAAR